MRELETMEKRDAQVIAEAEFASLQESQMTEAACAASQHSSQKREAKRFREWEEWAVRDERR